MWASLIPNSTTFLILIEQSVQSNAEFEYATLYINLIHDSSAWQNHSTFILHINMQICFPISHSKLTALVLGKDNSVGLAVAFHLVTP